MLLLALETSAKVASAALVTEDMLLAEYTINHKMTHSQTLLPMVDEMMTRVAISLEELTGIAVCSGPGSFTGLRIGAATAKGLAHGLNIPLIPVPTLDALAYNIFDTEKIVCPIMDARRQQVYTALYVWNQGSLEKLTDYLATSIHEILDLADSFGRGVIFLGDGVPVYQERILQNPKFSTAPPSCNMQRAATIGAIALQRAKAGKEMKGAEFAPFYLRKSQAEREREENLQARK